MHEIATRAALINYPVSSALSVEPVKNALITKSLMVFTARGIDDACLFQNFPPRMRKKFNLVGVLSLLKNRFRFLDDKDYYFIFNPWARGYHHWLAEVATKFVLFEQELRSGWLLVPSPCPPFIRDFFKLAGFENYKELDTNYFAREIRVVTNQNSGHFDAAQLLPLRDYICEKVPFRKDDRFSKIYVSRRDADIRKVINETELIAKLEGQGFTCVELSKFPFAEQVNMFRNCETLVSLHGAGLTNVLFMPAGGRVVELYPKYINEETDLNACYYRMSSVLDHRHEFIFCEREFPNRPFEVHTDNIYASLKDLADVLRRSDPSFD